MNFTLFGKIIFVISEIMYNTSPGLMFISKGGKELYDNW